MARKQKRDDRKQKKRLSRQRAARSRTQERSIEIVHKRQPPPLEDAPTQLARAAEKEANTAATSSERAWEELAWACPFGLPTQLAPIAETFVAREDTTHPVATLGLLLLALSSARTWRGLVCGRWITELPVHRYLYYDGEGYEDADAIDVAEGFISFLSSELWITEPELERLRARIAEARLSIGVTPSAALAS